VVDRDVWEAVTVLRWHMLHVIHVKKFCPEATWRDHFKTLVLPDVICASCQDCVDIDLCRDPNLQD